MGEAFPQLFLRHLWLLLIVCTCASAWAWYLRGRRVLARRPELAAGFGRLIRGFVVWANLPWLVMGAGCIFGRLTAIHYVQPQEGNPYVLLWLAVVVVIWIVGFFWVFFRGGAEKLAAYPGLFHLHLSPATIKVYVLMGILGGLMAIALMFNLGP